jgi:hypothetical protein
MGNNHELNTTIEQLIDENGGLAAILDAIAAVAFEKAEHLRSNWQDNNTAKVWEAAAEKISKLSASLDI